MPLALLIALRAAAPRRGGGRAERGRLDHGRPAAAQRAGSGRRRPPHEPLRLARRRPPARLGLLGPDRAAPGQAPQAAVRRGLAHGPAVQLRQPRPRGRLGGAAWAEGDDLDHDARRRCGQRATRPATTGCGSRSRPSSPCSRARSRPATATGRTSSRSATSRTSPAGCGRRAPTARYYAPHHYRRMVNAAFPAIRAASPNDTIMVGELAASGSVNRGPGSSIRPLAFLRAFACVSRSFHKLSSGPCRNFKAPRADVIGHHPYSFFSRPTRHSPNRDDAAIGDGRRLLRFLDRLVGKHRLISARGGKLNVHYTEFGYQTDPPDPYAGRLAEEAGPLAPGGGARGMGNAACAHVQPVPPERRPQAARRRASTPGASSRPACCSTTCARSRRTCRSATRSSSSG